MGLLVTYSARALSLYLNISLSLSLSPISERTVDQLRGEADTEDQVGQVAARLGGQGLREGAELPDLGDSADRPGAAAELLPEAVVLLPHPQQRAQKRPVYDLQGQSAGAPRSSRRRVPTEQKSRERELAGAEHAAVAARGPQPHPAEEQLHDAQQAQRRHSDLLALKTQPGLHPGRNRIGQQR